MNRANIHGRGQALDGDKTTSGATLISTLIRRATSDSRGIVRKGDPTTPCPKCGRPGVVAEGDTRNKWLGEYAAVDGHIVSCGCPFGSNRIIAPLGPLSPTPTQSRNNTLLNPSQNLNRKAEAKVTKIYWTYGENLIPVENISRHYTDLNLHIETENYKPGELVNLEINLDGSTTIN